MNTRGIMLKFLLTVILAIIIFAPACILTSKFFRLSAQAKDNFADLHSEMETFAKKASVGDYTGFALIMDENSYVAKFDVGTDILDDVTVDPYPGKKLTFWAWRLNYPYPLQCKGKECLVLCREFEMTSIKTIDTGGWTSGPDFFRNEATISCKEENQLVYILPENMAVEQFLIVRKNIDDLYIGSGDGVIKSHGYKNQRRVFITLVKEKKGEKDVIKIVGPDVGPILGYVKE